MKKLDFVIILVLLALAAVMYTTVLKPGKGGAVAVVYIDGEKEAEFPLDEDIEKTFSTKYGTNTIKIENGEVSMESADCPDQICVNHKPISKENESIICLPHKFVVEIEGGEKSDVDAIAK
ncbi:MAG: NusG domain II-containing protein [Clostridia bacterium]|nr:NusG domain II-containing protein [Clostridia bacterium]MCI1999419.1 NusG domain II-containing protein [Clostridia bacterium]MCI2015079.1 NusG domain II-containing protein [Clostridia bacterium]